MRRRFVFTEKYDRLVRAPINCVGDYAMLTRLTLVLILIIGWERIMWTATQIALCMEYILQFPPPDPPGGLRPPVSLFSIRKLRRRFDALFAK